ncbi:MAG TPA: acylphosphatase [candidate division WOR-3 bacterium]|uniref:acylphosphatase n=1 Tax=candidate division WOR-3 bacterium TaxID=2052148 RepID=A0A7V0T4X6_UNCW3|nr:acylphosphatase [candidate division WOR-3 bacterium]
MASDPTRQRLHALVLGRVQRVCYRSFVLDEARQLGLSGSVRNLPDGRVEVIAEGPQPALRSLVARLRTGPRDALVAAVGEDWQEPTGTHTGFRIES